MRWEGVGATSKGPQQHQLPAATSKQDRGNWRAEQNPSISLGPGAAGPGRAGPVGGKDAPPSMAKLLKPSASDFTAGRCVFPRATVTLP